MRASVSLVISVTMHLRRGYLHVTSVLWVTTMILLTKDEAARSVLWESTRVSLPKGVAKIVPRVPMEIRLPLVLAKGAFRECTKIKRNKPAVVLAKYVLLGSTLVTTAHQRVLSVVKVSIIQSKVNRAAYLVQRDGTRARVEKHRVHPAQQANMHQDQDLLTVTTVQRVTTIRRPD